MTVRDLLHRWEKEALGDITKDIAHIRLPVEDAAKIDALCDMYPRRSKEQIIGDLLSASLAELERVMPYIAGPKVLSTDELGDPIFEDIGPTPSYLASCKKHLAKYKSAK